MLEKPDLPDEDLVSVLRGDFGLPVAEIAFLPLGADVDTAVYRALTAEGGEFFVKLRRGAFDSAIVLVPHLLGEQGISQIIQPLVTDAGELWTYVDGYTVTLFPFIHGENGFDQPLSNSQWISLGSALRQIHSAPVPEQLREQLPHEVYDARWRDSVRGFQSLAQCGTFVDHAASQFAEILRVNSDTVSRVVDRAEQLGEVLRKRSPEMVLCHGDIHAGNVLIGRDDALFIVDWDTLTIAPKERDLMYVGAGIGRVWDSPREEALFYEGYGVSEIDPEAIAYYRYERIVQDIAAFGDQLLSTDEGGDDREQSLRFVAGQFQPNDVIDIAFKSDPDQ